MAILIANIGTADLAIQVDIDNQTYYLPIDSLDEPNLEGQKEKLSDERREIWKYPNQQKYITESQVYKDLGFLSGSKQTSRKLTEVLSKRYQETPREWHSRIRLTRVGGVIQKALNMGVTKAYIFVTDQKTEKNPEGHEKDTVYLFEILKTWLQEEYLNFGLEKEAITFDPSTKNQDLLLDYYYAQVNKIYYQQKLDGKTNELVLVSIKGGTPPMKVALQIQAMASQFKNLIFLDPQLNIDSLLNGHTSDCKLISYWRYQRTQKYEVVRQLLERWDFDGAIQILKDWQDYLKFLIKKEVIDPDIKPSSEFIRLILQRLDIARCHFNLDTSWNLNYQINPGDKLESLEEIKNNYDKLLNIYTQCQILWGIEQVANLSFRMSSFCEEILHELIQKLDGEKYFNKASYPDDWYLTKTQLEPRLWQKFEQLEVNNNPSTQLKRWDWRRKPSYKLPGRFSKRNLVEALIEFRGQSNEQAAWREIANSLTKLDYWIELRNTLTHSGEGFSKKSMADSLARDRQRYNRGDTAEMTKKANQACGRDEILPELTNIMQKMAELLNQSPSPYVGLGEPYYIYSDVKQWVLDKLQQEGLG